MIPFARLLRRYPGPMSKIIACDYLGHPSVAASRQEVDTAPAPQADQAAVAERTALEKAITKKYPAIRLDNPRVRAGIERALSA